MPASDQGRPAADTAALRKLRDTLAMDGDQRALVDARVQVDALLARPPAPPQTPPAALAALAALTGRLDDAIAALRDATQNAAHPDLPPPPASPSLPPWLLAPLFGVKRLTALTALAGIGALCLLLATLGLIALGRRLELGRAAAQTAMQEAMQAGGRVFDVAARRFARAQDEAGQAADTAADAAGQAGQAASRLASAVRETEVRLRACLDDAEARLNGAGAMARHYDQAASTLPDLLAEVTQTIAGRVLPVIQDASDALRDSAGAVTAQFEAEARALPALLADAILAVAARSLPAMEAATAALAAQASDVSQAMSALPDAGLSVDRAAAALAQATAAVQVQARGLSIAAMAHDIAVVERLEVAAAALDKLDLAALPGLAESMAGLAAKTSAALDDAGVRQDGSARAVSAACAVLGDAAASVHAGVTSFQDAALAVLSAASAPAPPQPLQSSQALDAIHGAIARIEGAAAQVLASADAQLAAASRVAEAAEAVFASVADQPAPPPVPPALPRGLAADAHSLHEQAGLLARAALRGDAANLPASLSRDAPALIASIETSIQRLRGTAASLALAGDAVRQHS